MKSNHLRIYIASPYRIGNIELNVIISLEASDKLMDLGHFPYAPLLAHFQNKLFPRPEADWMKLDLEYLRQCDCVLRLHGKSVGADAEVTEAKRLGIPVYFGFEEFIKRSK